MGNQIKRHTKALEEQAFSLNKLLKAFDRHVIASRTDTKGNLTYVSEAFCKINGYTEEELIGKPQNIGRHPDMPSSLFEELWSTIKSGKEWFGEIKNYTKDKREYWVLVYINPDFDKDGNITGYNAIRHDITAQKNLEELSSSLEDTVLERTKELYETQLELQQTNDNLEKRVEEALLLQEEQQKHLVQQSKMAAMGEMLSMIAHQWRQPLSAISATAAGLELDIMLGNANDKETEKKIKDISAYVQFMSATIEDFRNFFKTDKKEESVNLNSLLDLTLNILKLGITSNQITVKKDYGLNKNIISYKNEITQVLLNVLKNSIDNFEEKGAESPYIEITTYEENEYNIIKIFDNGGGIPDDIIEKIFEPYFSTKSEKNGTGLGLYMSKIIIDEHCEGNIYAKNKNDGVEFTIKLGSIGSSESGK